MNDYLTTTTITTIISFIDPPTFYNNYWKNCRKKGRRKPYRWLLKINLHDMLRILIIQDAVRVAHNRGRVKQTNAY